MLPNPRHLIGLVVWCVAGLAAAPPHAQVFDDSAVMQYCRSTTADNFDAWVCRDAALREYDRTVRIPDGHSRRVRALLGPAIEDCRNRWFPQWDMIRSCADQQVAPAMRIDSSWPEDGSGIAIAACQRTVGPDLRAVERCFPGAMQALRELRAN